ncbi:MAG TPA: peptidoglycan-binding domain-containing protein [Acidobacteriota bacterium]|nr:peptidoglycan-binding domain-containing protein [Acidobacteriota bacterium]
MGSGDPRIGSSSAGIQQMQPSLEVETHSIQKEEISTQQTETEAKSKTTEAESNSAPAKLSELNLSGQLQQMNFRNVQFPASSNPHLSTPAPGNTRVGGVTIPPKPMDVRSLQESLNKWRAENGQGAISVNGTMDADTESAIKEFQSSTGLEANGKPDTNTQQRLTTALNILNKQPRNADFKQNVIQLLRSPGFKSLGEPGQTETLNKVASYASSPSTLNNISNLKDLLTQPGFERNSPENKEHMLRILARRPNDIHVSNNLRQIAGTENFRDLDPKTQNFLLKRFERYGGDSTKLENLEDMITETDKFAQLPKETRDFLIQSHINNPDNAMLGDNFRRATNSQNFRNMPRDMQLEVLNHVRNYPPREFTHIDNLMELMTTPKFQELHPDVRDEILNGLPYMYDSPLNAARITNLMKFGAAPGFEKLSSDTRQLMLNIYSARPDNVQLAEALENLANDARFRHDQRNQRRTVMDVDSKIP